GRTGGAAIALFTPACARVRFRPLTRNVSEARRPHRKRPRTDREEGRMKGLIAAAGHSSRLQDLADRHNKVLLDLGGQSILGTILDHFAACGIEETVVVVGFDAPAVRTAVGTRARCLLNPFFEHYGILGSLWVARPLLDGQPFLFTVGDHYFAP